MTQVGLGAGIRGKSDLGRDDAPGWKLFGLVELDAEGTVLYTHFEPDGAPPGVRMLDYRGLNFYTEVVAFRNVDEFKTQLDRFSRGSQPAVSFDFTCVYENDPVQVRVLLARISARSQADETKSILVHIRRAR